MQHIYTSAAAQWEQGTRVSPATAAPEIAPLAPTEAVKA